MTRPEPAHESWGEAPPRPTVLADRYELDGLIGRGGMAEVHRAHDRALGRIVAVKLLPVSRADDDDDARRLQEEARAAAAINHANAVAVHDVGSSPRGVFVVMEHLQGRTWREMIEEQGRLPEADVVPAAAALCDALAVAHRLGVVHRDVSPANVMITDDGVPKLMDFGIARAGTPERITATGVVIGTAAYMSPEQVRDQELDGRSDVYSLGCTLYELLTGRTPFGGRGSVETAAARLREAPRPLRQVDSTVSAGVERVVLAALARDREDRPDATALGQALRGLLARTNGTVPEDADPTRRIGRSTTESMATEGIGFAGPHARTRSMTHPGGAAPADRAHDDELAAGGPGGAAPSADGPHPAGRMRVAGTLLVGLGLLVVVALVVLLVLR